MSVQLQLRRDTSANVAGYTGPLGEVIVDDTNNRLVLQDGVIAGGWAAAKLSEVVFQAVTLTGVNINATGDVAFSVQLPRGFTRYRVQAVTALHASAVPSSGKVGLYTAPSQGGLTIMAQNLLTGITTTANDTAGAIAPIALAVATAQLIDTTLYLNVGTANGSALTVDFQIVIQPYS